MVCESLLFFKPCRSFAVVSRTFHETLLPDSRSQTSRNPLYFLHIAASDSRLVLEYGDLSKVEKSTCCWWAFIHGYVRWTFLHIFQQHDVPLLRRGAGNMHTKKQGPAKRSSALSERHLQGNAWPGPGRRPYRRITGRFRTAATSSSAARQSSQTST